MSNYVKISTIGAHFPNMAVNLAHEEAVGEVMAHLKREVDQVLPDKPDLIVLPEACDMPAGYTLERRVDYYRARGEKILEFFGKTARDNHCNIVYPSIREMNDGTWRNSIRMIDRNGNVAGAYNKNHLFPVEFKDGILCGKEAPIIQCDFGRVACVICFDLNMDELRLKYIKEKPDLLIFSSMFHGGLMQNYWAYSCRSHFVGAIANDIPSSIISPLGEIIDSSTNYTDFVTATVNLDCVVVHLDYNYEKLKALKSKYGCKVKIADPGHLGSVLISSETAECTAKDFLREFEMESLDEYFDWALKMHHLPENREG